MLVTVLYKTLPTTTKSNIRVPAVSMTPDPPTCALDMLLLISGRNFCTSHNHVEGFVLTSRDTPATCRGIGLLRLGAVEKEPTNFLKLKLCPPVLH